VLPRWNPLLLERLQSLSSALMLLRVIFLPLGTYTQGQYVWTSRSPLWTPDTLQPLEIIVQHGTPWRNITFVINSSVSEAFRRITRRIPSYSLAMEAIRTVIESTQVAQINCNSSSLSSCGLTSSELNRPVVAQPCLQFPLRESSHWNSQYRHLR
jgi:hypothetical protein